MPDAAADEDRARAGRRRRERAPERPGASRAAPRRRARTGGACPGRRPRAGTARARPRGGRRRRRARGRAARPLLPPSARPPRASRTGRAPARALPGSATVMHAVDAELAHRHDLGEAAPERRLGPAGQLAHATPAPSLASAAAASLSASAPAAPRVTRAPDCSAAGCSPRGGVSSVRASAGRVEPSVPRPPSARPGRCRAGPAGRCTSGSPSIRAREIARAADMPGGERRQAGHAVGHGGAADLVAVGAGAHAGGRVDDEVDVAAFDPVDDVRGALADLVQALDRARPCARSPRRCRAWRRSGSRRRGATGRCPRRPPCLRR